jgi:hypothetical protein
MAYSVISMQNSFIRFDSQDVVTHCIHGTFSTCLPVYAESDIAFQFVVQAETEEEADALCQPYESGIDIGLVLDCDQVGFTAEFEETPERFRISTLQVLYNWPHGVPGMIGNVGMMECFYIRVVVDEVNYCTNCFQRIPDDCFTSVIEYSNEDNFAGFNYCNAGEVPGDITVDCAPQIYSFNNQSTLTIPYTASLQDRFGDVPTVQVWIYVDGELTNVGVVATFDAMPPTSIFVDFGGVSSGIIVLR